MALDFYHGHGSPYSWRVWLALEFKKIPYELKLLSFQNNDTTKPEFVALNPRHTVPTIVEDGFVLWESMAIVEYLDERYPGPKLFPGDARSRARIRRLISEMQEHLYLKGIDPITDEFFWSGDKAPDMEKVEKGRQVVKAELESLAKELRGKFLAGDEPCAADFFLAPLLGYVTRIDFRKPEAKLTPLVPAAIAEYKRRIEALPYYDKTYPAHWR